MAIFGALASSFVILFVILLVVGVIGAANSNTGTPTVPPGKAAAKWVTLVKLTGTGTQSTLPFTVPSSATAWAAAWYFDCSNVGAEGPFDYLVNEGTQMDIHDLGPNRMGKSADGVEYYYDSGTFNLQVDTACAWGVRVSRWATT